MLRVTPLVLLVYGGMLALTYFGYAGFPRGLLHAETIEKLEKAKALAATGPPEGGGSLALEFRRWLADTRRDALLFQGLPKGFIPSQDMGYLMMNVQLPDSASSERTLSVMSRMQEITLNTPGIAHTVLISGQSMLLSAFGSNFGSMFVMLKPFKQRPQPAIERFLAWLENPQLERRLRQTFHITKVEPLDSVSIANRLDRRFREEFPEAMINVLPPPPVRGVGRAGGFKMMIEDRGPNAGKLEGLQELQVETDRLVLGDETKPGLRNYSELSGVSSVFRANVPQVYVALDRNAAMTKEVEIRDIFDTMQVFLGSLYVNDFNLFGRTWQVIVQSDMTFRDQVDDIARLKVRNQHRQMVPLGSLADIRMENGPLVLTRYNMYPASFINGAAAPGTSSRQAIDLTEQVAGEFLPASMATEWTEMAYIELLAGNTAMIIFGFAVVMVFLVLAAQYESWSLPLAVILVVPMCLLSAIAGVWIAKMDINIFTQIGFVVLVGLASKNAILIVEFAKVHRHRGLGIREATLEACRLRLRPIIMTSMAFILGVVPLLLASGAGAEMRRTLGTAVFSGMLGVTAFGIFLTPVFFYVIDWLSETPLFAAGPLRRLADLVLGIVSLSALRKPLSRALSSQKAAPPPHKPSDPPELK